MILVTLLSPMIGAGTSANPFRPKLSIDFPAFEWTDITAKDAADLLGEPELVVINVVTDASGLAALQANTDYLVLDTEELPDE